MKKTVLFLSAIFLSGFMAIAGPTKVGNPDDGSDLEGGQPIKDGPIVESRTHAVKHLKNLNISGIRGLGNLLPELTHSELYMADQDVDGTLHDTQGVIHLSLTGKVYARTFSQPYAPTRFFPISQSLTKEQLKALHIHEALHRALPPEIRDDEFKVTKITLSITAPGATHDQVRALMEQIVPPEPVVSSPASLSVQRSEDVVEHYPYPSNVSYTYQSYFSDDKDPLQLKIVGLHRIRSELYPFGGKNVPLGFGIQASAVQFEHQVEPGPLALSARFKFWSKRQFDFSCWIDGNFNLIGSGEFENSGFDRDNISTGITVEKTTGLVFLENTLGFTFPSSAKQEIGPTTYKYKFGTGVSAKIKSGFAFWGFKIGGFGEVNFVNGFKVDGGPTFQLDKGRYHIISMGPLVSWGMSRFSVAVEGRWIVQARKGTDFNYVGNILGQGAGEGYLGGQVTLYL